MAALVPALADLTRPGQVPRVIQVSQNLKDHLGSQSIIAFFSFFFFTSFLFLISVLFMNVFHSHNFCTQICSVHFPCLLIMFNLQGRSTSSWRTLTSTWRRRRASFSLCSTSNIPTSNFLCFTYNLFCSLNFRNFPISYFFQVFQL